MRDSELSVTLPRKNNNYVHSQRTINRSACMFSDFTSFPKMKPPVSIPLLVLACAKLRNLTMSSAGTCTVFRPEAPTDMKCSFGLVERSTTGGAILQATTDSERGLKQ